MIPVHVATRSIAFGGERKPLYTRVRLPLHQVLPAQPLKTFRHDQPTLAQFTPEARDAMLREAARIKAAIPHRRSPEDSRQWTGEHIRIQNTVLNNSVWYPDPNKIFDAARLSYARQREHWEEQRDAARERTLGYLLDDRIRAIRLAPDPEVPVQGFLIKQSEYPHPFTLFPGFLEDGCRAMAAIIQHQGRTDPERKSTWRKSGRLWQEATLALKRYERKNSPFRPD